MPTANPVVLSRIELLNRVKKAGFNGGEDLPAIKSWLTAQGVDGLDEADGSPIDLDASWAKTERKGLKLATESKAREVSRIDAMIEAKEAPAAIVKDHWREMSKKRYQAKANRGLTRFEDADFAETVAATFRLQAFGNFDYSQKKNDEDICKKAQSTYTNTGGQSLIEPQFLQGLLYATEPFGVARKLANVVTMTSDITLAKRKTGIFALGHRLPTGSYASSQNAYDNVQLTARDVGALIDVPQNLIDDVAINIIDELANTVQEARGIREDTDWIAGDGSATYGNQVGLANALPSGAYINGSGNTYSAITDADVLKLIASVQNANWSRCAFVMSRQCYIQILVRLAQAKGGNRAADIVGGASLGNIPYQATYQGFPVYFEQNNMTSAASPTGLVAMYFGDFMGGSMLGSRNEMQVDTSKDFKFDTGFISVRVRTRECINICGDGRGSTVGPIAALKFT